MSTQPLEHFLLTSKSRRRLPRRTHIFFSLLLTLVRRCPRAHPNLHRLGSHSHFLVGAFFWRPNGGRAFRLSARARFLIILCGLTDVCILGDTTTKGFRARDLARAWAQRQSSLIAWKTHRRGAYTHSTFATDCCESAEPPSRNMYLDAKNVMGLSKSRER